MIEAVVGLLMFVSGDLKIGIKTFFLFVDDVLGTEFLENGQQGPVVQIILHFTSIDTLRRQVADSFQVDWFLFFN